MLTFVSSCLDNKKVRRRSKNILKINIVLSRFYCQNGRNPSQEEKMIKKLCAAAGLLLLLSGIPAIAAAEGALTGSQIEKFLSTWAPLQALGEKYSLEFENSPPPAMNGEEGFNPFMSSLAMIQGHKAYGEFQTILSKAGFASSEEWAMTANRIMRAYMAATIDTSEFSQSREEINQAIKDVQNNPHISNTQKQAIINNLKSSLSMMTSMKNISQDDLDAVKPYLGKIEQTLSEEYK